ncbi:MAG: CpaD family pilus assembly protein [Hyphomonadaceae bacterium]
MMLKAFKTAALMGSAICIIALPACQSRSEQAQLPAYLNTTPLDMHPITVEAKTEFLEVRLNPSDTQLRQSDRNRISNFVSAYSGTGHGPLIMSMPADGANTQLAVQAVAEAREIAWELGVEYEEISGNAYSARGDVTAPLILAYQSYEAIAPQCQSLASVDISNTSSNNELPTFGCAVRKNFAAMIADPADLYGARTLGEGDVLRRAEILDKFRRGEPTGATRSADESGTVSTAVSN